MWKCSIRETLLEFTLKFIELSIATKYFLLLRSTSFHLNLVDLNQDIMSDVARDVFFILIKLVGMIISVGSLPYYLCTNNEIMALLHVATLTVPRMKSSCGHMH